MAIINLCKSTDKGAQGHLLGYCHREYKSGVAYKDQLEIYGPTVYWTNLSHVGLCIQDSEQNGYNDSDFFMLVWNEEKQEPETIMFATTRGWSYPCYGSWVDATPEVLEKYKAWAEARREAYRKANRKAKANELRAINKHICEVSASIGVTPTRLLMLRRELRKDQFEGVMKLLTSKLRSGFRLSLKQQIVNWLTAAQLKYRKPLTPKQMTYI